MVGTMEADQSECTHENQAEGGRFRNPDEYIRPVPDECGIVRIFDVSHAIGGPLNWLGESTRTPANKIQVNVAKAGYGESLRSHQELQV